MMAGSSGVVAEEVPTSLSADSDSVGSFFSIAIAADDLESSVEGFSSSVCDLASTMLGVTVFTALAAAISDFFTFCTLIGPSCTSTLLATETDPSELELSSIDADVAADDEIVVAGLVVNFSVLLGFSVLGTNLALVTFA